MTEDKQAILNALLPALQLTLAGKYITELIYDTENERVQIVYASGNSGFANVAPDMNGMDIMVAVTCIIMVWSFKGAFLTERRTNHDICREPHPRTT